MDLPFQEICSSKSSKVDTVAITGHTSGDLVEVALETACTLVGVTMKSGADEDSTRATRTAYAV